MTTALTRGVRAARYALALLLLTGVPVHAQSPSTVATARPASLHSCRPENPPAPLPQASGGRAVPAPAQRSPTRPEVRLIYLVPSDRTINPAYVTAIANAGRHLQGWYQQQLGNTKTFALHSPIVETYQTTHAVTWYQTNGSPSFAQFYDNAAQDVFTATGGSYNDPNYVYAIYIDAESACGQCGGCGGAGVLVVGSNDLKGLVGQPSIRYCPTDPAPVQYPPCRWVGGLGHELGHAFGLPHPPDCDQGLNTCDYNALMWAGYVAYPNTYLRADEKATLNQSAFFRAQGPSPAPALCNNLLASQAATPAGQFNLVPNPALAAVRLLLPASAPKLPLTLLDALGRQVRHYPAPAGRETLLDLRGLPAGIYVLRGGTFSQRLQVLD
jgi:hypothetical protein